MEHRMTAETYPFVARPLPYEYDALLPAIDEETLHFHHDKHYKTYVDNLNNTLADYPELQQMSLKELLISLEELPAAAQTPIRNNGGGVYNHELYFDAMKSPVGQEVCGELAEANRLGRLVGTPAWVWIAMLYAPQAVLLVILLVRTAKLQNPLGRMLCTPVGVLLTMRMTLGLLYQAAIFPLFMPLPFISGNLYTVMDAALLGLALSTLRQAACPEPAPCSARPGPAV